MLYKNAANWELHPAPYIKIETEAGSAGDAYWHKDLNQIWHHLPGKVRSIVDNILERILIVEPNDERLRGANAATINDTCIISKDTEPDELLHEIGHILISTLLPNEVENYSEKQRSASDVLAEDFYFMMKGSKPSPFWENWLMENDNMRSAQITRKAENASLQLVEAVLDELAELILSSGNEQFIVDWGIAKDALKDALKQDRFSYENLSGPRQYYYKEDMPQLQDKPAPMSQPLQVSRPDVTMRETTPGGGSLA